MTKEELAEEYVSKLLDTDNEEVDKLLEENLCDLKINKRQAGTILGIIKGIGICSFLAGLKAGKDMNVPPKWHDLRKNPEDLPKKDCEVIVLHENGRKHIQKWADGNWVNAIVVPVITWCEIPKYTEE